MAEQNDTGSNPTPIAGMEDLFDEPTPESPDREREVQTLTPTDVGARSEVLGDLTAPTETKAGPGAAPKLSGGPDNAEAAVEPQTGAAVPEVAVEPEPVFVSPEKAQKLYQKANARVKAAQTELEAAHVELNAAQRGVQTALRRPTLQEMNQVARNQSSVEYAAKAAARDAMLKLGIGPRKVHPPLFTVPAKPAQE